MTPNPNPSPESVKLVASALCHAAGMDPEGGGRTGYSWINHEADARTLLATLTPPTPAETVTVALPGAGEGMVLVPRVPTEAMLKAGQAAADDHRWKWCGYGPREPGQGLDGMMFHVREAFTAMLDAFLRPAPAIQLPARASGWTEKGHEWLDSGAPLATVAAANDEGVAKAGAALVEAWNSDGDGFSNTLPPIEFSEAELAHLVRAVLSSQGSQS